MSTEPMSPAALVFDRSRPMTDDEFDAFRMSKGLSFVGLTAITDAHRCHWKMAHILPDEVWSTPPGPPPSIAGVSGQQKSPVGVWSPPAMQVNGSLQRWRWREDGSKERAYEHQIVMSEHLGRDLRSHEYIRFVNGDKSDCRIENLQLLSRLWPSSHAPADLVAFARDVLTVYGAEHPADAPTDAPDREDLTSG